MTVVMQMIDQARTPRDRTVSDLRVPPEHILAEMKRLNGQA